MLELLFLFYYIEFYILNKFVHKFFQILQMSSFQKNLRKSTENVCEQWEITESNNWTILLIFDDKG